MENRAAWRAWLSKNHALYNEVWLVLSKKHARHSSVTYTEAVKEAICFGWIDGQAKTIDAEKVHAAIFTPETKESLVGDQH